MDHRLRPEALAVGDRAIEDDIAKSPINSYGNCELQERKDLIERNAKAVPVPTGRGSDNPSNAVDLFDENVLTLGFARRFAHL